MTNTRVKPTTQTDHDETAPAKVTHPTLEKLKSARERYASSFTIHAAEHIVNGTVPEKIFWSLKLMMAIGAAIFLSGKLFVSFYEHEVDTKVTMETQHKLQFPMILIGRPGAVSALTIIRNNCSSNQSVSYDKTVCDIVNRDCPDVLNGRVFSSKKVNLSECF